MRSGTVAFLLGVSALHGLEALPGLWAVALLPAALHVAAAGRFAGRLAALGWCTAGFVWALLNAHGTLAARLPSALDGNDLVVTGRIASIPSALPRRTRFDFEVDSGLPQRAGRLRLSWYANAREAPPDLATGETWRLVVRLRAPRGLRNPGGFDYETWLFANGYAGRGYVRARDPRNARLGAASASAPGGLRFELARRLREIPGLGPAGALVEALVVGVRDRISDDQREVLRRTGTAHLLAISGLHIGLAAGIGFAAGRLAGAWLVPGVAPVRIGALAGMAVAAGYAALAGFSLPTRRALVMAIVVLGALLARRRLGGSTVFCLGLLAVLVLEPAAVLAPGFWLSFCAVAALLFGVGGRPHPSGSVLHWRRWALPQLVVTLGLAPLIVHWFEEQPVAGPLANAIAIPFVGVAVLPALLAGGLLLSLPGRLADLAGEALVVAGTWGLDLLWELLGFLAAHGPRYTLSVEPSLATTALAMAGAAILLAPPGLPGRWAGALWIAPLLWWTPAVPRAGRGPGRLPRRRTRSRGGGRDHGPGPRLRHRTRLRRRHRRLLSRLAREERNRRRRRQPRGLRPRRRLSRARAAVPGTTGARERGGAGCGALHRRPVLGVERSPVRDPASSGVGRLERERRIVRAPHRRRRPDDSAHRGHRGPGGAVAGAKCA